MSIKILAFCSEKTDFCCDRNPVRDCVQSMLQDFGLFWTPLPPCCNSLHLFNPPLKSTLHLSAPPPILYWHCHILQWNGKISKQSLTLSKTLGIGNLVATNKILKIRKLQSILAFKQKAPHLSSGQSLQCRLIHHFRCNVAIPWPPPTPGCK